MRWTTILVLGFLAPLPVVGQTADDLDLVAPALEAAVSDATERAKSGEVPYAPKKVWLESDSFREVFGSFPDLQIVDFLSHASLLNPGLARKDSVVSCREAEGRIAGECAVAENGMVVSIISLDRRSTRSAAVKVEYLMPTPGHRFAPLCPRRLLVEMERGDQPRETGEVRGTLGAWTVSKVKVLTQC
jgi:hypothetical protein